MGGHIGYTHPGGSKPLDAKNQDTWFALKIDEHNQVWGVLDGHGSDNGTLVADVCAAAIKGHLAEHFNRLRTEPEAVFTRAFELAHEAARKAVLEADPTIHKLYKGVVVEEYEDERGELARDVIDGGTTATVIALVDGATLVHAQVGDSSALLGGRLQRPPPMRGEAGRARLRSRTSSRSTRRPMSRSTSACPPTRAASTSPLSTTCRTRTWRRRARSWKKNGETGEMELGARVEAAGGIDSRLREERAR